MAKKLKDPEIFLEGYIKWFLLDEDMPGRWLLERENRPNIYALKEVTDEGEITFTWVSINEELKLIKHIGPKVMFATARTLINDYNKWFAYSSGDKKYICNEIEDRITNQSSKTVLGIIREEKVLPIGFADDGYVYKRLPFNRPKPACAEEPGKIEYIYYPLGEFWDKFRKRVADYDEKTEQSSQFEMFAMMLAETLTSKKPSKAVLYLWGSANSGKTTIVDDIGALMGNAYKRMTLEQLKKETKRADLPGVRLVASDEAPKGDTMDDDLKNLTGAPTTLDGRHLYSNSFTFPNTMMLWVMSNHRPIGAKDGAIFARYRAVELREIPKDERIDDTAKRRQMMLNGLQGMIQLGLNLIKHYGGIPENDQNTAEELLNEELEEIIEAVNRDFEYKPGEKKLRAVDVKEWNRAQQRKFNWNRLKLAFEKMKGQDPENPVEFKRTRQNDDSRPTVVMNVARKNWMESAPLDPNSAFNTQSRFTAARAFQVLKNDV